MYQRNVPELIKKHFHYLFNEYGFAIIDVRYFDNYSDWVAVLTSPKCRLQFFENRGSVTLAIGPSWDPPGWQSGPWIDLQVVTAYLNQGIFTWDYELGSTEPQLRRLSEILQPYVDRVCAMFSPDVFPEHEDELHRLWDKRYGRYFDRD